MISATQKAHIRPVHPFPARMAPSIVWDSLSEADRPLRVLDPMSGSGTTLVCARAKGHYAMGCDTDPLSLVIARAWCSDVNCERLNHRATLVLERARDIAQQLNYEKAYPKGADEETRQFVDFWFDDENRRQLAALSTCIARVRCEVEKTLLWCAFSRLIITKSVGVSLATDVSHSRPHKVYKVAPIRCFDSFQKAVEQVAHHSPFQVGDDSKASYPAADVRFGDVRRLPIESKSVDMIITSPPYLNAIDYLRGHKLSLVWMGHCIEDIRRLRSENIGSEVSYHSRIEGAMLDAIEAMGGSHDLDNRRMGMMTRYAHDMNRALGECARVLRRNGYAIFVVGDSSVRGVFIRNSDGVIELAANHGFSLVSRVVRPIAENRRYLPPPDSQQSGKRLQSRMREEVILKFTIDLGGN
jgi:tRNA G10  N-methylase Trm11